jgi:hypothetical protein
MKIIKHFQVMLTLPGPLGRTLAGLFHRLLIYPGSVSDSCPASVDTE